MKVFYFLFCWLFCAIVARAEKDAGIYEALFYYYAYRIEGSVFPDKDQRSIGGLECRSKLCTFNEFVKSWATDTTTVNWLAAGDTTTPVVEGAETTFADMNWVDTTYRMDKLFKQSTKINHLEMFRKMTNRIQECREQADVDSGFISSAATALEFVQKKRWEANFAKTQKSFNENYAGVTLQVKQQPLSDGTTETVIDWDKTGEEQAKKTGSKPSKLINNYKKWASKSSNMSGYNHHQAISQGIANCRNVLNSIPSCRAGT